MGVRFDPKNYGINYAMHVRNKEEASMFLEFLDDRGSTWKDGTPYTQESHYKAGICYRFNTGTCAEIDFYTENGVAVLEFSDFDWGFSTDAEEQEVMSFADFLSGGDPKVLNKKNIQQRGEVS